MAEALVSIRRLQKFMMYDEVIPANGKNDETTNNSKQNVNDDNKHNMKDNGIQNANDIQKKSDVVDQPDHEYRISIENGSAKWLPYEKEDTLQNINIKVRPGELIAIVGQVGSGKSSLLNIILNELRLHSGSIHVRLSSML